MRILIVADTESRALYDFYDGKRLKDVDLILSAGDLDPEYLEFLVTMGHAPVLYVMGNHDDRYKQRPPQGCICVDESVYNFKGLRIAGLGGSIRYKQEGIYQYQEQEQRRRVRKLKRKIERYNGIDLLLTHAPARGLGDGKDLPHKGFECFYEILDTYRPKYFVHGHEHLNYGGGLREQEYRGIKVINGYESYLLDIDSSEYPSEYQNTGSLLFDLYNKWKYKTNEE